METTKPQPEGLKTDLLPRITQIVSIEGFIITAVWNTGELRQNDFTKEAQAWHLNPFLNQLQNPSVFAKAELRHGALEWPNATVEDPDYSEMNTRQFVPINYDPETMYAESTLIGPLNLSTQLVELVKNARKQAGITQQEMARRSGFSKQYINRLESGKTDIQVKSLLQILEMGLGKRIELVDLDADWIIKMARKGK